MQGELEPAAIDAGFVPQLRSTSVIVPVEEEAVLYDEGTGALHHLDPIATVVCSSFDGSSVRGIAAELAAAFGADRDVVEADLLTMVRQLGAVGMLAGVGGDSPPRTDEDPGGC